MVPLFSKNEFFMRFRDHFGMSFRPDERSALERPLERREFANLTFRSAIENSYGRRTQPGEWARSTNEIEYAVVIDIMGSHADASEGDNITAEQMKMA